MPFDPYFGMQDYLDLGCAGLTPNILYRFDPMTVCRFGPDCFRSGLTPTVFRRFVLVLCRGWPPTFKCKFGPRLYNASLTPISVCRFDSDCFYCQVWPRLFCSWGQTTSTALCRFGPDCFVEVWPRLFYASLTPTMVNPGLNPTTVTCLTVAVSMQVWPWLPSWQGWGGPEADGDQLGGNKTNICVIWKELIMHNFISGLILGTVNRPKFGNRP